MITGTPAVAMLPSGQRPDSHVPGTRRPDTGHTDPHEPSRRFLPACVDWDATASLMDDEREYVPAAECDRRFFKAGLLRQPLQHSDIGIVLLRVGVDSGIGETAQDLSVARVPKIVTVRDHRRPCPSALHPRCQRLPATAVRLLR